MAENLNAENFGFLSELHDKLENLLGIGKGTEFLKPLLLRHAGTKIYIPSETEEIRRQKYAWIRAKFDGSNYHWLSQITGFSERWIREIVNGKRV